MCVARAWKYMTLCVCDWCVFLPNGSALSVGDQLDVVAKLLKCSLKGMDEVLLSLFSQVLESLENTSLQVCICRIPRRATMSPHLSHEGNTLFCFFGCTLGRIPHSTACLSCGHDSQGHGSVVSGH